MANEVLKRFSLRCSLTEIATKKNTGVRVIEIQGYYGNDAVIRFVEKLKKEGKYELDQNYSYFELGPVASSEN